jgi:hypothetical protein
MPITPVEIEEGFCLVSSLAKTEKAAACLKIAEEVIGKNSGAVADAVQACGEGMHPFSALDRSQFKFMPARSLATSIANAEGPTLRATEGPSGILFDRENAVQQIRYNLHSTPEERANLLLTAGYANMVKVDSFAARAAGTIESETIGFNPQPTMRLGTLEQMQKSAVDGAHAYVTGNPTGANRFTSYLTEEFGPLTSEDRAWGQHIILGDGSENVFNRQLMHSPGAVPRPIPQPFALPEPVSVSSWDPRSAITGFQRYLGKIT